MCSKLCLCHFGPRCHWKLSWPSDYIVSPVCSAFLQLVIHWENQFQSVSNDDRRSLQNNGAAAQSTWKKYPDGSANLRISFMNVACCLVPALSFLYNNYKMAGVNHLMSALLNSAAQNKLLFLQGWSFNGQVGGRTKLIESNDADDNNH